MPTLFESDFPRRDHTLAHGPESETTAPDLAPDT